MAKKRRITVAAVNVTMHPHSHSLYSSLFRDIHEGLYMTPVRGADWGMLGTLADVSSASNVPVLGGSIWRFLNLDPKEPWLDLQTRRAIEPDTKGLPIIPQHLKPHLRTAPYVFMPHGHRLFLNARQISPGLTARMLTGLFSEKAIADKYGDISATVESEEEALSRIDRLERRAMLEIFVKRPNADDLSSYDKRVMERLGDQGAASLNEKWTAPRGGDIKPDRETRALMKVGLSNGHVRATGYDKNDARVQVDTQQHPLKVDVPYDPDHETVMDILLDTGRRILRKLTGKG